MARRMMVTAVEEERGGAAAQQTRASSCTIHTQAFLFSKCSNISYPAYTQASRGTHWLCLGSQGKSCTAQDVGCASC